MYSMFSNNSYPYPSISPQRVEIPHVNGQNGAQAYQIPSNSSVLLLDDNAPIVYLVRTDSACYKTVTPYTIQEYVPEPPVDVKSLLDRVSKLERSVYESDTKPVNTADTGSTSRASQVLDEYTPECRKPTGGT